MFKKVTSCFFQQTDKAAFLFRQYVKDSLYDRISTRPFLNNVEKKWIAFQLLCALNQCHKLKVIYPWVKVFRIIPELRILRLIFIESQPQNAELEEL